MDIKNLSGMVGNTAPDTPLSRPDAQLKNACADFEGIMLQQLFESMKKTVGNGGVFGDSHQKKMYESMFIQEVSTTLARQRGVGLAEALYRQVARQTDDENGVGDK